jgi:hypothetical protein
MRSTGVNLGPTGRVGVGAGVGVGVGVGASRVPKSVCATPYKALRNPINRPRCDLNLDSTTYTKIKT